MTMWQNIQYPRCAALLVAAAYGMYAAPLKGLEALR